MRKNQKSNKLGMRIAALGLTLVMIIPMIGSLRFEARAASSLSGIEKIKKTGLSILEITPQAGSGSIGYYVGGSEPTRDWTTQLARTVGATARETYAETLFSNLQNLGLMGDTNAYPLTFHGVYEESRPSYQEYLPWANNIPESANPLKLSHTEETTLIGKFDTADDGDYVKDDSYVYSKTNPEYIENAIEYVYGNSVGTGTAYYYHVTFKRVKLTDNPTAEMLGKGYVDVQDYVDIPLYITKTEGGLPYYECVGTLRDGYIAEDEINDGSGYFIAKLDQDVISPERKPLLPITVTTDENGTVPSDSDFVGRTLYVKDDTVEGNYKAITVPAGFKPYPNEAPAVQYYTQDKAPSYSAILNPDIPYRLAKSYTDPITGETITEKPYFIKINGYRYVGNGNAGPDAGYMTFVPTEPGPDAKTWTVKYDTIYYTGGYSNNEWFKRYVLDMDDNFNSVKVTVNSVTLDGPTGLTETAIKNADLVVVSAGLDLASGNTIGYATTTDLKDDHFQAIIQKPRVVDTSLTGPAKLVQLKDGKNTPSVSVTNNVDVYYFAKTIVGENTEVNRLATNQFNTKIEDADRENSPYQLVTDEIEYENLLRVTAGKPELPTDISMAACIRYVINAHLPVNKKTALHVLDIQPAPHYDETSNSGPLTVEEVLTWIPESMKTQLAKTDSNGNTKYDITITHMSTAALVGKIEDITEEYDLIYIGAAEKTADTTYVNDMLDGYHYANIGKESGVGSSNKLQGLLDTTPHPSLDKVRFSGNDLTLKKRNELESFAKIGIPVVVSNKLVTGGSTEQTITRPLTVNVDYDGTTFVATHNLSADIPVTRVTYQWWRKNTGSFKVCGSPTEDGRLNTNYLDSSYQYYCEVTVYTNKGQGTARSDTVKLSAGLSGNKNGKFSDPYGEWDVPTGYSAKVTTSNENKSITFNVFVTINGYDMELPGAKFYMYQGLPNDGISDGNPISETSSRTFSSFADNVYYYWKIRVSIPFVGEMYLTSPAYKWIPSNGSTSSSYTTLEDGFPANITATVATNVSQKGSLDENKIDNTSLMYDALKSVWKLDNVMSQSAVDDNNQYTVPEVIQEQQFILMSFLNLSRPSITLSKSPADYVGPFTTENANGDTVLVTNSNAISAYLVNNQNNNGVNCEGILSYEFTINNTTDPDPANTRYQCNLYIDQNGDGRHSKEECTDVQITQGSGASYVTNGTLEAGITYTLHRPLGPQHIGVVPWKLEVFKVGDSNVHASVKGYAYNHPTQAKLINVLQIRSGSGDGINLSSDTVFTNLYDQVRTAGMYNITIDTKTITELNNLAIAAANQAKKNGATAKKQTEAAIDAVFNTIKNHAMLVLGFKDMYGNLNSYSAQAVVKYIGTGKAVLFTHDTTSYWNIPETDADSDWSNPYWGYWFNYYVRDEVGLDRYGVTNATAKSYGVAAGDDLEINPDEAGYLRDAGYTPAFLPGSASSDGTNPPQSARETQGYTNSIIKKYSANSNTNKTTNAVSQVNQGQITEYPYKLKESFEISETHNQYYQLNMNAKDIVVWYCLGGSATTDGFDYSDEKNDVTNAYYIYNRGNITYSGAGHTPSLKDKYGNVCIDEAALFVNTMVAAYRATQSPPTVEFKTAAGADASMLLFPVQTSDTVENGKRETVSLSGEQYIYFKIQDNNLTTNKSIKVELYYDHADGSPMSDSTSTVASKAMKVADSNVTVYRAGSTVAEESTANLTSGVLYKMEIPSEVLDYFAGQPAQDAKIYLKAITTIYSSSDSSSYSGSDNLTLRKLGLLRLE